MEQKQQNTLVGCLTIVAFIVVLVSMLMPTLDRARELGDYRCMCASNIKSINTGVALYAEENSGMAPILPDMDAYAKGLCRGKPNAAPHASNGQGTSGAYDYNELLCLGPSCTAGGDPAIANDQGLGAGAQQNLCLLVRYGSVGWGLFNCPSARYIRRDRTLKRDSYGLGEGGSDKTPKTTYIHYGIQIPYMVTPVVGTGGDNDNRCPMIAVMDPKVAWAGDRGPCAVAKPGQSAPDTCTRFSPNHWNDGENVLFGDGHVEFIKDTNNIQQSSNGAYPDNFTYKNAGGYAKNNIYTHDYWQTPAAASTSAASQQTQPKYKPVEPILIKHGTKTEAPVITAPGDMPTKDSVIYDWMMFP